MRAARRLAFLPLLLAVSAAAAAVAVADEPPPDEPAWTPAPLRELGLDDYVRTHWRAPVLTLPFRTRLDRVVTAARLSLALAPGRSAEDAPRALAITVNGVEVARLARADLASGARVEVPIDPRLFTARSDLGFTVTAPDGAECLPPRAWSWLADDARLETRQLAVRDARGLDAFPLPLADARLDARAEIPVVFAAPPSLDELRAAFLVAGSFAVAGPRRLSFSVHIGELPPASAVVIATADGLAELGLPAASGLALVDHPRDPVARVLIVTGAPGALAQAAARLPSAAHLPSAAESAGRLLEPGELVRFSDLTDAAQLVIAGRRDGEVRIPFRVRPGVFSWRERGLGLTLVYDQRYDADAPRSKITLSLNGHYLATMSRPAGARAPGLRETRLRLPAALLTARNELTISSELDASSACPSEHSNEYFSVAGGSTIDLRGASEFVTLPDLGQLARTGFPFTRAPGLGETAIALPRAPGPAEIAALLALAAHLARVSGEIGGGAQLLEADQVPAHLDRDLIVLGLDGDQPLLRRFADRAPARFAGRAVLAGGPRSLGASLARIFRRDPSFELERELQARPGGALGMVASFASPLAPDRTVVALTATDAAALPDLAALSAAPASDEPSDVAIFGGAEPRQYRFGRSYGVGHLGPIARCLWALSLHAWLLVLLVLVASAWLAREILRAAAGRVRRRLLLGLLLLLIAPPARADASPAGDLERRAAFWESRGRGDKAAEIWEQLLELDPASSSAAAGLARCRAMRAPTVDAGQARDVAEARKLAAAGRYAEAIAAYHRAFGDQPPPPLALEYFETLAGSAETRRAAQAGLARLAGEHPGSVPLALAHARALTYDEATRRDGIRRLEALDERASSPEVRAAWRQALLWLHAGRADARLFDHFLARQHDDRGLAERRARLARGPVEDVELERGYAQLNAGEVEAAAATFAHLTAVRPGAARVLVGASWVALRQSRFRDARELAERARKLEPMHAELWQAPLRSAELWLALDEADRAAALGKFSAAEALLRAAPTPSAKDAPELAAHLARVVLAQGRDAEAAELLRPFASGAPRAIAGLYVEALERQGKRDEAARYQRELLDGAASAEERRGLFTEILIARARAAHDDTQALALLDQALALEPADRKARLARVYRLAARGELAEAETAGRELLLLAPRDPEALAAVALTEIERGDPAAALRTLARIDAAALTPAARALTDRATVLVGARALVAHRRAGAVSLDREAEALEQLAGTDLDLRATVAQALLRAGRAERALAIVREVMAADPPVGVRLRCAGLLLEARPRDPSELARVLDELAAMPRLDARAKAQLASLRTGLLVRRVDADRRASEFRRGFSRLEPALKATPDDPVLLASLARLDASAGRPREAGRVYALLLERDPENLQHREGAAFAAVAAGDERSARAIVGRALDQHPKIAAAWLLAGRVSVALGDDVAADKQLRAGLELAHDDPPPDTPAPDGSAALLADARADFGEEPDDDEEPPPTSQAIRTELEQIAKRYAPAVHGGVIFRFRSGEPGQSRLFEVDLPFRFELSPHLHGRFSLELSPVFVTAERLDLTDPQAAERFGTGALIPGFTSASGADTDRWGFAASLRYAYRGLLVEIGATPLGFLVMDFVGQLGWRRQLGFWTMGVRAVRQAVTDSVLSYSGQRDSRTGFIWGGVRREGGEVELVHDRGEFQLHLLVSYWAYTGKRVEANHGGQYSIGGLWRFLRRPNQTMSIGVDVFAMHYAHNLRYFTWGQGGYFSPQAFIFAGVPLSWERRGRDWMVQLAAQVGANWYAEDPSPFFPNDTALQVFRSALPQSGEIIRGAVFPGSEHVGAYAKLHAVVSHEVGHHWFLDGMFDAQFSPAFTEVIFSALVHKICN